MRSNPKHLPTYAGVHYESHQVALFQQLNAGKLRAFASAIRAWLERSRQRRALAELDDRLLRDIGLTRSQAQSEAAKPFWCAGKA
jgi:uncharacterized protein YjiS (DUF1127 family)